MNASAVGRWRAMISLKNGQPGCEVMKASMPSGGVRDGPRHELELGMVAVPLEQAPSRLRVSARPVAQLARCLGMDLGPALERHGARRRGGGYRRRVRRWRGAGRLAATQPPGPCH